jgi:hypothetical protein
VTGATSDPAVGRKKVLYRTDNGIPSTVPHALPNFGGGNIQRVPVIISLDKQKQLPYSSKYGKQYLKKVAEMRIIEPGMSEISGVIIFIDVHVCFS